MSFGQLREGSCNCPIAELVKGEKKGEVFQLWETE